MRTDEAGINHPARGVIIAVLVGALGCRGPTEPSRVAEAVPVTGDTAALATGFAWIRATPESQGMCGTSRQLGCTRTLADIWNRISSSKFNTQRFIVIRNDKVIYDRGGTQAYPVYSSNKALWGAPTLVHAMSSCGVHLTDKASKWLGGGAGTRWRTI